MSGSDSYTRTRFLPVRWERFVGVVLVVASVASSAGPVFAQPAAAAAGGTSPIDQLRKDAETAYQKGRFDDGINITNSILTQVPNDHVALYLRASCRVELGQARRDVKLIRAGIEDTREALRHGGSAQINYYLPYLYGMTGLAYIENRKEHADISIKIADSVLARTTLKPEDKANILYQRAGAQMFSQAFDGAAADYQAAIAQYPTHLGAHVGLAESYIAAGKPEEALKAFNAAAQAFPTNPLVFNNRGIFLQQQNRAKDAIADFSQSLKIDPQYFVGYTNRGFAYLSEGNAAAAEADFGESLKINPQQPLVHSLRGTARLSQGRVNEAVQDYTQVLGFDAKNPVATADLGFAKYFAKDYAGATAAFDQAVALDGNLRYLNPWRYWTLVMAGQKDAATAKFADSLGKDAAARDWLDNLVCFMEGKISEQELVAAVNSTDAALKNLQTCEAYFFIAERRTVTGDAANATAFYQKALESNARHLSAYRGSQFALKQFAPTAQ